MCFLFPQTNSTGTTAVFFVALRATSLHWEGQCQWMLQTSWFALFQPLEKGAVDGLEVKDELTHGLLVEALGSSPRVEVLQPPAEPRPSRGDQTDSNPAAAPLASYVGGTCPHCPITAPYERGTSAKGLRQPGDARETVRDIFESGLNLPRQGIQKQPRCSHHELAIICRAPHLKKMDCASRPGRCHAGRGSGHRGT